MRRLTALTALAGTAAFALAKRADAQSPPAIRVAVGGTSDPHVVPFYARDEGFFTKAGLNAELVAQPTIAAGVQAVLAGAADVAQADIIMLANAAIHGLGLTAFAGGGIYHVAPNPSNGLLVNGDSPIHTARDLEGKRMGVVTLSSLSAIGGREWMRIHGGNPATLRLIEIPLSQMPGSLQRNLIDVAVEVEPFLDNALHAGMRSLGDGYGALAPFYDGVWVAKKSWLTQNLDLARRFTDAIYTTSRWANAHQSDTAVLFAKYSNYELDVVRKMTRTQYAVALDPKLLDAILTAAYRYKTISDPVKSQDLITRI